MGMMILRSAAARAKAGRNFSEIPSQISGTPISTRPVANCRQTNSSGSVTRTASGTFSGAKPSLAGSASRRTARRLNSTVATADPDGGTGALRFGGPMGATGALGSGGNTDPDTTMGAWGGRGWMGKDGGPAKGGREATAAVAAGSGGGVLTGWEAKAGNGAATAAKGLGTDGGRAAGGATGTPDPAKPIGARGDTAGTLAGAVIGTKGDTAGPDGGTGGAAGETVTPKGVGFDSAKGAAAGIGGNPAGDGMGGARAAKGEPATANWAPAASPGLPEMGAGVGSEAEKGLVDMAFTGKRLPASAKGLDGGADTGPEATAKGEPAKLGAAPGTAENGLADAAGAATLKLAGAAWAGLNPSKMPTTRAMDRVTSISSSARNGRWKRSGQAA